MEGVEHPVRPVRVAMTALMSLGCSLALLLVLHILTGTQRAIPVYLSDFAITEYNWLWATSLVFLAGSAAATAVAMRRSLPQTPRARIGQGLVWGIAVGSIAIAALPTDPNGHTINDDLHTAAAAPTFVAMLLAPAAMAGVFARDAAWHPMRRFTWLVVAVLLASYAAFAAAHMMRSDAAFVFERLAAGAAVLWLAAVAWKMRAPTPQS